MFVFENFSEKPKILLTIPHSLAGRLLRRPLAPPAGPRRPPPGAVGDVGEGEGGDHQGVEEEGAEGALLEDSGADNVVPHVPVFESTEEISQKV